MATALTEKPILPEVSLDDVAGIALEELSRARRTIKTGYEPPPKNVVDGCISYIKGRVINAYFQGCAFPEELQVPALGPLTRVISGEESFRSSDSRIHSLGQFKVVRSSAASPSVIVREAALTREMSIDLKGTTGVDTIVLSAHYVGVAPNSKTAAQEWTIAISGDWRNSSQSNLALQSNGAVNMTCQGESGLSTKLRIQPNEEIQFSPDSSGCLRPIGTFAYTATLQTGDVLSGTLVATPAYYRLSGNPDATPWPKNCNENSGH